MTEYRKALPEIDADDYWHVDMGPIPGKPEWHGQSRPSSYPFPTEMAAMGFAATHKMLDPDRAISVRYPDGTVKHLDLGEEDAE